MRRELKTGTKMRRVRSRYRHRRQIHNINDFDIVDNNDKIPELSDTDISGHFG